MDASIGFRRYLDSIYCQYAAWWERGVLTDSERQQEEPFNFDLQAREIKTKPGKVSKSEEFKSPLPVIKALHQLVETKKQIVLVGQPGAGKTKTLWRYLLKLAEQAKHGTSAKIPILIRLKDYQVSSNGKHSGLIHLIRKELVFLESEEIERYLFLEQRFLLLIDGLNESTSPELRRDLQQFCNNCHRYQVPIVFTTRSLGYRDLEIETQLEIQSISPEERQRFLANRVSPSNQHKLRGWLERTHQSNYTPFVLWMLAEICQQTHSSSQIAETFSLGEAFQEFIRLYQDRLYEEERISEEDWESWNSRLKQLAFEMLSNEKPEEQFIVSRRKALDILKSETLLNNLIRHHLLLERRDDVKIEFCHQLLQEYYAAKWLFERLPNLTNEQLKYYFLNHLKWTEPVALMLTLVEKVQAVRVVESALEVDWILGAKLSGSVNAYLQENTISVVEERTINQKIPPILKIKFFGETCSYKVINLVKQGFSPRNLDLFKYSIEALNKIDPNLAIEILLKILSREYGDMHLYSPGLGRFLSSYDRLANIYSDARIFAIEMLAKVNPELAIEQLSQLIAEGDVDPHVRWKAAEILSRIGSQVAVPLLLEKLSDPDPDIRQSIAEGLGIIGSDQAVPELIEALEDTDSDVRFYAAVALGMIGSFVAIPALALAMKDLNADVRAAAAEALGQIGSDVAISDLTQALNDPDEAVRGAAALSLRKLSSSAAIEELTSALIQDLNSKYLYLRIHAAGALEYLGSEAAIPSLLRSLSDHYTEVRAKAALALGAIGSNKAITGLVEALEDKNAKVREHAAIALGKIKSHVPLSYLIQRLDDQYPNVRCSTAKALGSIGSEEAVEALVRRLKDSNLRVRVSAIEALGEIASIAAVEDLIQQLTNDPATASHSVIALAQIGSPLALSHLYKLWLSRTKEYFSTAIVAIQERCRFYNYEIAKADPPPPINFEKLPANGSPTYNFYDSVGNVAHTVHGDQISHQDFLSNFKQLTTNFSDFNILAEDVLKVIFNIGLSLERSSKEVRSLSEESLRDWFTSSINVKYLDSATGETRNKNGKTDILVRVFGRNILIVECKFWGGEEKLKETLDQLLDRYTTVRDTQIAILIFSRNKDFTNVKQSIPQAIKQHSSFGREISIDLERAWYEYVVFHPDDRACELTLTVLAFHLPS